MCKRDSAHAGAAHKSLCESKRGKTKTILDIVFTDSPAVRLCVRAVWVNELAVSGT